jgi:hypothetical protein
MQAKDTDRTVVKINYGEKVCLEKGQFWSMHLHGPHMPGLAGCLAIDTYHSWSGGVVNVEMGVSTPIIINGKTGRAKSFALSWGESATIQSLAGNVEIQVVD